MRAPPLLVDDGGGVAIDGAVRVDSTVEHNASRRVG
jgi:hypothetical protein